MMSEKEEYHEDTLPINTPTALDERRKQWKLRRLVAFVFLLLGLWQCGTGVRSLYKGLTSGEIVPARITGSDELQGYYNRVTGIPFRSISRLTGHSDKHDKHHKHKHDKHKHRSDKHGKGKHGHGDKGDHKPHGPPKWISPREAEEIFLTVPSNDSIRA